MPSHISPVNPASASRVGNVGAPNIANESQSPSDTAHGLASRKRPRTSGTGLAARGGISKPGAAIRQNNQSINLLRGLSRDNADVRPDAPQLRLNIPSSPDPAQPSSPMSEHSVVSNEHMADVHADSHANELPADPPMSPVKDHEVTGDNAPTPTPSDEPAPRHDASSEQNATNQMKKEAEIFAESQREMAQIQMLQSTVTAQTGLMTTLNDALNERTKKFGESMKSAAGG